jgi:hypothetical protein
MDRYTDDQIWRIYRSLICSEPGFLRFVTGEPHPGSPFSWSARNSGKVRMRCRGVAPLESKSSYK